MILRNVKFDFNETWIFRDRFSKNTQISNLMKIRPVGAWFSHADGRTDMKLVVAYAILRTPLKSGRNQLFDYLCRQW